MTCAMRGGRTNADMAPILSDSTRLCMFCGEDIPTSVYYGWPMIPLLWQSLVPYYDDKANHEDSQLILTRPAMVADVLAPWRRRYRPHRKPRFRPILGVRYFIRQRRRPGGRHGRRPGSGSSRSAGA